MKMSEALAHKIEAALEYFASHHEDEKGDSLRRLIPRGNNIPYLYRNFLAGRETPDGEPSLLLHKFVASDAKDELHNHPWSWSVSFILSGRYREIRSTPSNGDYMKTKSVSLLKSSKQDFSPGDHNFISGNTFHRVELLSDCVWTLFLHGPRVQYWGFCPEKYGKETPLRIVKKRTFQVRPRVQHAG